MQPLNRILLVLILIGAGIYYWRQEKTKREYQRQVGALSSALDRRYLSSANPAAQSEAMFLRALVILADFRSLVAQERLPPGEDAYLQDALANERYEECAELVKAARKYGAEGRDIQKVLADGARRARFARTKEPARKQNGSRRF